MYRFAILFCVLLVSATSPAQINGFFDHAHTGVLEGWAYDTTNHSAQVWIHFYEDIGGGSLTYLMTRPSGTVHRGDVQATFGLSTAMVGFATATPQWQGIHTVHAYASSSSTPSTAYQLVNSPIAHQYGDGNAFFYNGNPFGELEFMGDWGASGWACDPDSSDPVDLEFWIQPNGEGPYELFATARANYPRGSPVCPPGLGTNEYTGFYVEWESLPSPGNHNIWVVAKNIGNGSDQVLWEDNNPFNFPALITFGSPPNYASSPLLSTVSAPGSSTHGATSIDIDGDGSYELAFGFELNNKVRVFDAAGALLHEINGPSGSVEFGWSIDAADQDGDGDEELLVGDPKWNNEKGRVCTYDFSGTSVVLEGCTSFSCICPGHWLGFDVAALGDNDGDGFGEFVAGAPRPEGNAANFGGFIRIFEGTTLLQHETAPGDPAKNRYGWSVERLGDVNGNGLIEFAVGAPFYHDESLVAGQSGTVYIYEWNGTNASLIKTLANVATDDGGFGFSIAGLDDVDGDGVRDYVVGAPYSGDPFGLNRTAHGRVHVFAGGASLSSTPILSQTGLLMQQLGASVAAASDLNGDGLGDFVASSMTAGDPGVVTILPFLGSVAVPAIGPSSGLDGFKGMTLAGLRGETSGELLVGGWNHAWRLNQFGRVCSQAGCIALNAPNSFAYRYQSGLFTQTPVAVSGMSASDNLTDRVTVTWSPLVGVGGYNIYRSGALAGSVGGADTVSFDDFPAPGTYSYTVAAFNSNGVGAQSSADSGTRLGPPPVVMSVTATDTLFDKVTVSWGTLANADGYRVYRDGVEAADVTSGSTGTYDDFCPPGTFEYTVVAYNAFGDAATSTPDGGTRTDALLTHVASYADAFLICMEADAAGNLYIGNNANASPYSQPLQTVNISTASWPGAPGGLQPFGPPLGDTDGLAFNGNSLYVADRDTGIQEMDLATGFVSPFIAGVGNWPDFSPLVWRASDGHLFVAGNVSPIVAEYDAAGQLVTQHVLPIPLPNASLALDDVTGDVFATYAQGPPGPTPIYRITPGGGQSLFATIDDRILVMEFDPFTRRVLVGTGPSSYIQSTSYDSGRLWGIRVDTGDVELLLDHLDNITGLAVDPTGRGLYLMNLPYTGSNIPLFQTIYWLPTLPGTVEDVRLDMGANGPATPSGVGAEIVDLIAGDTWNIHVDSPAGTLYNQFYVLVTQLMPLGALPLNESGFDSVWVNGTGGLIIGQGGLLVGGASLSVAVPPGLAGLQLVNQAFVLMPAANNGVFAATHGRVVRFVP